MIQNAETMEIQQILEPVVLDTPSNVPFSYIVIQGGLGNIVVISLLLIALFIAAWKAPRWVKEIGKAGLVTGIFFSLKAAYAAARSIGDTGVHSAPVISGMLECILIPAMYGLIVYFVSLVIMVLQKPRI